jgi:hypothetical protein
MCHDDKEFNLKITPIRGETKLNLVSKDKMENEQVAVVVYLEQLQGTHWEAK